MPGAAATVAKNRRPGLQPLFAAALAFYKSSFFTRKMTSTYGYVLPKPAGWETAWRPTAHSGPVRPRPRPRRRPGF